MVRAVTGTVLLLIGLPALLVGAALWFVMQHQDTTGGYSASLATIATEGYAAVASDVDGLLRREAPFTRSERTTLRLSAQVGDRPAFIGLAPATDVARYLSGVPYTRIEQVRLARGQLPVVTSPVPGARSPAGLPDQQPFWVARGESGTLEWSPYETRGRQLALVVMDRAGAAAPSLDLTAQLYPHWLASATFGLLVLGAVLVLVAVAALAWPSRAREIVYVVPPAQVPDVAAHLGIPVPRPVSEPCPDPSEACPVSSTPVTSPPADAAAPVPEPDELEGAEPSGQAGSEPDEAEVAEPGGSGEPEEPAGPAEPEKPGGPAEPAPAAAPVGGEPVAAVPCGRIAPRLEWPPQGAYQPTAPPVARPSETPLGDLTDAVH